MHFFVDSFWTKKVCLNGQTNFASGGVKYCIKFLGQSQWNVDYQGTNEKQCSFLWSTIRRYLGSNCIKFLGHLIRSCPRNLIQMSLQKSGFLITFYRAVSNGTLILPKSPRLGDRGVPPSFSKTRFLLVERHHRFTWCPLYPPTGFAQNFRVSG